jgi:hypothetical protein
MDEKVPTADVDKEVSGDPGNPYNIDYARERRLRNWFIGLIGGAFLLAAILILLAFIFDVIAAGTRPAVKPPAPPAQGVQTGDGATDGPVVSIT